MQEKNKYPKEEVISILKEWASPVLIGIVGMLLWRDVTEMRADVKLLLTQQSADKVRIEQLESDVDILKKYVFEDTRSGKPVSNNGDYPYPVQRYPAIIQKQEDELPYKKQRQ